MAITWRAVALTAIGVVPVLLLPVSFTVLAWTLLVVLACAVDLGLAASPRLVAVRRTVPRSVRLTESTRSTLTVTNRSGRRLRAVVRDAWQPSAGATEAREHRFGDAGRDTIREWSVTSALHLVRLVAASARPAA